MVLGFSAPFLGLGIFRLLRPPLPVTTVAVAQMAGRDPFIYHEMDLLLKKAEDERHLSDVEWKRVLELFARPNSGEKADAMRIMSMISESEHKKEIITIAKENLKNADNHVEFQSLRLLWLCHAPEWREEANKRIDSKEENIREIAQSVLRKGEYVRKGIKK